MYEPTTTDGNSRTLNDDALARDGDSRAARAETGVATRDDGVAGSTEVVS